MSWQQQRPRLNTSSEHLVYLYGISKDLQWRRWRATQGGKFQVHFIETFSSWKSNPEGQVVIEFLNRNGEDNFIAAIRDGEFPGKVQYRRLKDASSRKIFFRAIEKETGVDLLTTRGIPEGERRKTGEQKNFSKTIASHKFRSLSENGHNSSSTASTSLSSKKSYAEKDSTNRSDSRSALIRSNSEDRHRSHRHYRNNYRHAKNVRRSTGSERGARRMNGK